MFLFLATLALTICVFIGGVCLPHIKKQPYVWLICYLAIDIINYLIYELGLDPTGVILRTLYCILIPIEYFIYVKIFNLSHKKESLWNTWIHASLGFLFIFALFQLIYRINTKGAATDIFWLMSLFTIILVMYYFWSLTISTEVISLKKEPLFWIASGLLFYYTSNIISTGFFHRIIKLDKILANNLYQLNAIFGIMRCTLFSVAFILQARK